MAVVTPQAPVGALVRAGDLLGAEWIKLASVRSTVLTGVLGVAGATGVTLLFADSSMRQWDRMSPEARSSFDPIGGSFGGFLLLQLAVLVVGALAIGGEYSSGLIRTTLTAAPARRRVLLAKAAVVGGLGLLVGGAAALFSAVVAQTLFAEHRVGVPLLSSELLTGIAATAVRLGAVAVVGLALTTVLRSTAGGVVTGFAVLFIAPVFLRGSEGWMLTVHRVLMESAVRRLTTQHHDVLGPSAGSAWVSLFLYPAVTLALAAFVIGRRDV
ncbi:hypothetical protein ACIGZJ_23450 [Kitasatospora sp. NPDC052868]|uniref:hypothetical protein n=1 Tax=Kitasatospora sp. NPDC052868 TaxID=3364060 RepID=UPI0037CBEB32